MEKNTRVSFDSKTLVPGITAGVVVGIIVVTISISLATFIFSGELGSFAPRGIGLLLFSGMMMSLTVAALSSLPGAAIGPQDGPSALLAVAAAGVASGLAGVSNPEVAYHTVVAGIILSTLATGLAFFLIGQFKLGNLVRYIPYPVIGGFLAGTGWLITRGTLEGMAGQTLSLATLPSLFTPDALFHWLPGTIFAVAVLLILRKYNHFLIWPGIVLGGIAIFYGLIFARGMTLDEARAAGQFMEPFGAGGLWRPFLPQHFLNVEWAALSGALASLAIIPLVSLIAFLLNASALELVAKRDVDLNHELRVAGLSNVLAGLGGGSAGYHFLGATALAFRMGAQTRIVSLIAALVCGLALVAGGSFISLLPTSFLNGMLRLLTNSKRVKVHYLSEARGFVRVGEVLAYAAKPLDEATDAFTPLQPEEADEAAALCQRWAPNGYLNIGWKFAVPGAEVIRTAMQDEYLFFWWHGRRGLVSAWEEDDERGNSLKVGLEACAGESRVEMLGDFRRLASARGMVFAGWMNLVDEETSRVLEQAGFQREWENAGYLYERRHV